jgi:Flp pilus assembly CpaE family ATPase
MAQSPGSELRKPAPLLAVCALCGGAGASTLACLIARAATKRYDRHVLLGDAGGPSGGLSLYVRAQAPRSLAGLANQLASRQTPDEGLFADAGSGLRVLAGAPDLEEQADPEGLARLLGDATQAHALTVVDCGTLHAAAERQILEMASHVAWVIPATPSGVRRGRRMLELFPHEASRREVVVARRDAGERSAPTEALAALAAVRNAGLVLMPHVPDLIETELEHALDAAAGTLEAIWTVIRR